MTAPAWEYGSDFHFISGYIGSPAAPWLASGQLTFSGRIALLSLLEHLTEQGEFDLMRGTLWLPAYTCDQMAGPLQAVGYRVRFWDGSPVTDWAWPLDSTREGDIWLLHNYFGLDVPGRDLMPLVRERGILIIEDHSHGPLGELALGSHADYAFASLRKTLPLPDGGVLWSPRGRALPTVPPSAPPPLTRIAAMLGKAAYLRGELFPKGQYREWFAQAEAELAGRRGVGLCEFSRNQLTQFDTVGWQAARDRNLRWLWARLTPSRHYSVLGTSVTGGAMGLVLHCRDGESRDQLRAQLAAHQIYSAVLWPLPDGVTADQFPQATAFQARMLFLHADGRYDEEDLSRVCERLEQLEATL
ncbi:hypothetical protein [Deinococcus hohokamensis]|uniref:DegT/DnrJ/EryC1/StrS aminotransferase family protein n=1 Tax=Deinococcus hohokamensis TaxID=309883 RepID=A0ABV9IC95_9DEIO